MLNRYSFPAVLIVLGLLTSRSLAQAPMGQMGDDQQEIMAQFQEMQQQVMQNLQAKGIDPQEFFGQFRQQLMDGTMTMADMQQQLVDKGLLDKKLVERFQGTVKKATAANLKQRLGVTDEEWAVLEPKLQKVLDASAAAGPSNAMGGRGGGMAGFMSGASANNEVTAALKELRAATNDPATDKEVLAAKLAAWRAAHEKAKADLAAAQGELVEILTVRQEAVLMAAGVL